MKPSLIVNLLQNVGIPLSRLSVCLLVAALLMTPLFLAQSARAAGTGIKVGKNVDIRGETAPDKQIMEPALAVDPRDPSIVVASAEDHNTIPVGGCFSSDRCHSWGAYSRSTDGGVTWITRLLPGFPGDTSPEGLSSPLQNFAVVGHTSVAFDRSGNVYYSMFVCNATASGGFDGKSFRIAVAKFANDGRDYVGTAIVSGGGDGDSVLPRIAVDATGGPFDSNIYVTFINVDNAGNTEFFTRSSDGGATFSKPIPMPGSGLAVAPVVDPAGNVFVESVHCFKGGPPCGGGTPASILVTKSTDGGLSFGPPVVVAQITADPAEFPGNNFGPEFLTVVSWHLASDTAGVYVVWDDFGTGNADVLFSKSTDGGLTWTSPIRVNDVAQGEQFLPGIAVSGGIISVAWYDSRLGQLPNGTITNLDVFYAESTDGGATFSKSIRVTSSSFDPNLVNWGEKDPSSAFSPFLGDRLGLAASPAGVLAAWTDNRNACDTIDATFGCVDQDVLVAKISP